MSANRAFDMAVDSTKQILTLSTAILAALVTFGKDYILDQEKIIPWTLRASWICYLLSILFGVWTLLALTGTAARDHIFVSSIYRSNIRIPALLQCVAFLLALGFTVAAAWR